MPVAPTFPGVYIEEIPSGVRTITGVSTSVSAFIGFFPRGPLNQDEPFDQDEPLGQAGAIFQAVQIFSQADFDRSYGGLHTLSEASYGIRQYFLNGGAEAWVVRCTAAAGPGTPSARSARIVMLGPEGPLTLAAASPGAWGDRLQARVAPAGPDSFDLTVSEISADGRGLTQELFRGLTTEDGPHHVATVLNEESRLVRVTSAGTAPPFANGTISAAFETPATFSLPALEDDVERLVSVTIGGVAAEASLGEEPIPSLTAARDRLQAAIRAAQPRNRSFSQATVELVQPDPAGPARLRVLAGPGQPGDRVEFANVSDDDTTAADLGLVGGTPNVQIYTTGAAIANTSQGDGRMGLDGALPGTNELVAALSALDNVAFNLLSIPRMADPEVDGPAVIAEATRYCQERRAFLLVDPPAALDSVQEIRDWLNENTTLRSRDAALYFPRLRAADPLNENRLRSFAASGTIAGLYARTDGERGVWKAPAGTDATLRGVRGLDFQATDAENGALNPLAINTLRRLPIFGHVAWGARTLDGADQQASEWKYVPVRRTALFIEESLYRGLQWVVFEPNDEPLWAQIRLNVGAFMNNLFRQGAFQGRTPREAYLVKCDRETTTQNDINLGIVNILVGFAPLKPAEFVIVSIQQLAGQIAV
jgi:phage tail sheath protein FI